MSLARLVATVSLWFIAGAFWTISLIRLEVDSMFEFANLNIPWSSFLADDVSARCRLRPIAFLLALTTVLSVVVELGCLTLHLLPALFHFGA